MSSLSSGSMGAVPLTMAAIMTQMTKPILIITSTVDDRESWGSPSMSAFTCCSRAEANEEVIERFRERWVGNDTVRLEV